ncbi:MAG TPA: sulfotransferase [Rhodanobacteraceae bacterium]|nr:sulfotransferase [Rhodanobacteraceae bacterium]
MTHSERESEPAGGREPAAATPAPAPRQRSTAASRLEGLSPTAIRCVQVAARTLDLRDFDTAAATLRQAASLAPGHPEIVRLEGVLAYRRGQFAEAIALLRQTLAAWPDDAPTLGNLGSAFADAGRIGDALMAMRRACEVAPDQAAGWFNLGRLFDSQAHVVEAEKALARAIGLAPQHLPARIAHAGTLATLGRTADAAAGYRAALAQDGRAVQAWLGLVNLKTVRLEAAEAGALERLHADAALPDGERAVAGFALGKVLEDAGRHDEAFAVLSAANAARRGAAPWDASAFSRQIDAIESAFSNPALAEASDATLGMPVTFVVSLPRSGSTLVEQILAAHPAVEGASELPDLESVILEESARRGRRFPEWIGEATPDDWQRMGQRYLQRTARWRKERPRFTDKMPDNWLLVGAALAMLPGARVVNVRRDAVETCWSCFKQLFAAGRHAYSYDLADLADTWRDYDRLCRFWSERFPDRVREQSYEALLADPEGETRALLAFCGLPFDEATLRPHETGRSVRTASAAQVREPMRADTARSAAYGERLEPLRRMLATPSRAGAPTAGAGTNVFTVHRERVLDLAPNDARDLVRAAALLGAGRSDDAATIIERVHAAHPEHPEALRLAGALDSARGRHAEALATLARASALMPDDALILNTLGAAQAASGVEGAAIASFARAAELDPAAPGAPHNLGRLLAARGDLDGSREAFVRALAIEPGLVPARIALADVLARLDRDDEAAHALREALARDPQSSAAWEALAELRPAELTTTERSALESEFQRPRRTDGERAALGFALAHVLEGRGQYREAFASYVAANALRRRGVAWDGARHAQRCGRVLHAFPATAIAPSTSSFGAGCIVLLGLPDATSSGIARTLRAHPEVDAAAGADPARVIAAESKRRGQKFFEWAPLATWADWERLGTACLGASPRTHRVIDAGTFAPELAGAVALMLPGARFVTCTGDALESAWSCFRSDFRGAHAYSYDLADLAAFWHAQRRLAERWSERHAERILHVDVDALRSDPNGEIARILAHAGLAGAALAPDRLRLRERADARAYGDLLKPLAGLLDAGYETPTGA